MHRTSGLVLILTFVAAVCEAQPRGRDLGVPFEGQPGPWNAITDVAGVTVGHTTLIGDARGNRKIRTGVTAILPRGPESRDRPVVGAWFALNGNGEMTGTAWLDESGELEGPIVLTNTHSVGVVRDAVIGWRVAEGDADASGYWWSLPVVAETWDGYLNDINGFHVKPAHVQAALDGAATGPVAEGNVGAGTGTICYEFKCGIGTASRRVRIDGREHIVGILVQANHGLRGDLRIAGVPVGAQLPDESPGGAGETGSIIIVVATDAPLLPHQLKRLARRAGLGLARMGSTAGNGSGDLFIAFSTANRAAPGATGLALAEFLGNGALDPLFAATVQATEEAIVNALVAGRDLVGTEGHRVQALPQAELRALLSHYRRLPQEQEEPARMPTPPPTRAEPIRETLHGVELIDPYRWLEGDNSNAERMGQVTPAVAEWTDAQNAHTRAVLDGLPGRQALEERLRPLMEIGTVTKPIERGGRYFFSKREGSQNQPVWYWRQGVRGETRTLLDPAVLDPSGLTTITWISPGPDGRTVAYGSYRAGDENTTLRLLDVDRGVTLPLEIPNRTEAPDWLPDGSGFVYRNLKDAKDPYSGQVMFHRLGSEPGSDALLFRQYTKEENQALATTWGPYGSLSRDGRWLVLMYFTGTRSNDLWVADFGRFLATGVLDKQPVSVGRDGTIFGAVAEGRLFLQTMQDAPNGRIEAVDLATGARYVLVPERSDATIDSLAVAKGVLAVGYIEHATSAFELFDYGGRALGRLALPGLGTGSLAADPESIEAFLSFESFNYPETIFRVDLARPQLAPEVWERPEVPVDPSAIEVKQVWYPSKDGTRISMFLVHRKGLEPDGARPTILYGYGGFNISMTPTFSATLFPWLEDGGVYAVPNLRGGGEYGDAWHEAGMLANKQNVFDDFIAAAEWLVANRYTNRERLAIQGGSNGGLLTGAVAMQRPDLCQAAIVAVPLLDMLRYQNFLMARYWVPEYGSAEKADEFQSLLAYSPYHRVQAGTRYPAIFLTAGENDTRVHALHARKMAARLQAAVAGVDDARPVLLWVDREAGHGQGKPLKLRIRDAADLQIFLRWQLGVGGKATGGTGD
jgi:prolyl oligopeptidase